MTDRREFLIGSLAVAGLAGCAGVSGDGLECHPRHAHLPETPITGSGEGRILFGACRSSVEDVTIMRDLGYDFWEWGAGAAFDPAKDDEWWKRQKDEIAKRPLPLRSCNGFIPGKFRLTGPKADHAPALDYAEKVLRRAMTPPAGSEDVGTATAGADAAFSEDALDSDARATGRQIEIVKPGPLLDDSGRLAALGFAKAPLLVYNRKRIKASPLRIKEWDYYFVVNDGFAAAFTVSATTCKSESRRRDTYQQTKNYR